MEHRKIEVNCLRIFECWNRKGPEFTRFNPVGTRPNAARICCSTCIRKFTFTLRGRRKSNSFKTRPQTTPPGLSCEVLMSLDTLTPGSCERECKFAPVGLSVQMCSMTETGSRPTVSSRAAWISSKTSGSTSFDRMAFKASRASKVPICPKAHAAWPLTNGEL